MHRLLLALTCLLGVHGAAVAQSAGDRPVITVTLLGTGAPPPLADRLGPATLVQAGGQTLLFDAGRGSTIRLWQLAVPGSALTATFLTHLHSDHVVGLPDLWLTGWVRGPHGARSQPFRLVGPPGTTDMARHLEQAFAADVRYRVAQGLPPEGARIAAEEFTADGVVHDHDGVRLAQVGPHHLGDMNQGGVSGCMAQRVVDAFEAIEVEVEQHRRHVVSLAEGHGALHRGDETTAVQGRGQYIVVRRRLGRLGPAAQGLDLGAEPLDLGDGVDDGRVGHRRNGLPGRRLTPCRPAFSLTRSVAGATRVLYRAAFVGKGYDS